MQAAVKITGSGSARKIRHEHGGEGDTRRLHWYIAAVVTALVLLIGVGVLFGRALLMPLADDSDVKPKAAAHAPGYYMRRLEDGRSCRVTVFDHDRGEAIEDKITRCEEFRPPPSQQTRSAPSFDTRPKKFNWGSQ